MKKCDLETTTTILKDYCFLLAIIIGFFIFIIPMTALGIVLGIIYLIQKLRVFLMMIDKDSLIKKLKYIGYYFLVILCSFFVFFSSYWLSSTIFNLELNNTIDTLVTFVMKYINGFATFLSAIATVVIAYFTFEMSKSVRLQSKQLYIAKESKDSDELFKLISSFRNLVKEINGSEFFSEIIGNTIIEFIRENQEEIEEEKFKKIVSIYSNYLNYTIKNEKIKSYTFFEKGNIERYYSQFKFYFNSLSSKNNGSLVIYVV